MEEVGLSSISSSAIGAGHIPYPPPSIEAVMGYLHSSRLNLEAKRTVFRLLKTEVANENIEKLKDRLQQISALQQGWDGDDALQVNSAIADFVRKLINCSRPYDLADWSLFPNINGTLLLQKENAGISIGKEEFSYFAESGDDEIGEDHVPLSTEAVVAAIKRINSYATD